MADANDLRALSARVLTTLTPHPHRGDLIAAGAVPLGLGVLLVNARFHATWGTGLLFVVSALACALVLGMGLLAPLEGERPRAYHEVLLLVGLALGFTTLARFAQVLGADEPLDTAGSLVWIAGVVTLGAAWIARTRRAAICVLIAALGAIVTLLSFVDWVFSPESPATTRWLLLALAGGFVLAALARRERERRESVYLVDAAGVAIVVLGATFFASLFTPLGLLGVPIGAPGAGWKLVLLAAGLGLVAYACVDREPGPAYLGTATLLLFVLYAGIPGATGASLWFWPLALLLVGGVAVGVGLRPRRELPPEPPGPGGSGSDPPTQPLPGPGARSPSEADTVVRPRGGLWASPPARGDDAP